jgi:AcrR family transcriptional regulator
LRIIRDEGADQLTLGHLAIRAGVSKPVAYDHFGTRTRLLVELYREIDQAQVTALHSALTSGKHGPEETARVLAEAYIRCAADTGGEWQAVVAALAGSPEKHTFHRELLDGYVQLFRTVLAPHSSLPPPEFERQCIGLVGAAEALSAAMIRGACSQVQAAKALTALMLGSLAPHQREATASQRAGPVRRGSA